MSNYQFCQCRLTDGGIDPYYHQHVKCQDPTGAGAVERATFLVPLVWNKVTLDVFHLNSAETKMWICLDGDLDTELDYVYNGSSVVANSLGIMCKSFFEK